MKSMIHLFIVFFAMNTTLAFGSEPLIIDPSTQVLEVKNSTYSADYQILIDGVSYGFINLQDADFNILDLKRAYQSAKSTNKLFTLDFDQIKYKIAEKQEAVPQLVECKAELEAYKSIVQGFMTNQINSSRSSYQEPQAIRPLEQSSDLEELYFR